MSTIGITTLYAMKTLVLGVGQFLPFFQQKCLFFKPGAAEPVSIDVPAPAADDDATAHADVKHGGHAAQSNGRNGPGRSRAGRHDGADERARRHAAADEPADDDADAAANADATESAASS